MRIIDPDFRTFRAFVISVGITMAFATSCTKENKPVSTMDRQPVQLSVATDKTKALVSGTTLPETYTVYASAYFTSYTAPEANGDYFIAKPFRPHSGIWAASPAVYWPVGGKLDILSVACENEKFDLRKSAAWHKGNSSEGIEVTLKDGDCLDSEILFAAANDRTVEGGSVPMQFKHAQSWLQFVINCETEILRIDRIVLENVYAGGLFRVGNNVYLEAGWSFRGHRKTNVNVPGSEGLIPRAGTPSICNILVPEQDACNILIYYSVKGSPNDEWIAARNSVYRHPANVNPWYYGEKNIYDIGFSFAEFMLKTSVQNWEDETIDIIPAKD